MRIVGIVLAIAALLIGIGANLAAMIDAPSLIIVIGGAVGMLLLGGSRLGLMVSAIASVPDNEEDARAAAKGWKMARIYLLGAGLIGSIIGWVIVLKNLDDPSAIGPGLAISLLTVFWALVIAFVLCLPCQANAEKAFDAPPDGSAMTAAVVSVVYCTLVSLGSLAVLMVTLKP